MDFAHIPPFFPPSIPFSPPPSCPLLFSFIFCHSSLQRLLFPLSFPFFHSFPPVGGTLHVSSVIWLPFSLSFILNYNSQLLSLPVFPKEWNTTVASSTTVFLCEWALFRTRVEYFLAHLQEYDELISNHLRCFSEFFLIPVNC